MARSTAFPTFPLLFLLLLAAGEMMPAAKVMGDRICSTPSLQYKGLCFRSHNCRIVCNGEGFPGGHCHGFRRRCLCTHNC